MYSLQSLGGKDPLGMLIKKNPKVDLEKLRTIFFLAALALSLGFVLVILEHKTALATAGHSKIKTEQAHIFSATIPITVRPAPAKLRPKPKAKINYTLKPKVAVNKAKSDETNTSKLDLGAAVPIASEPGNELLDADPVEIFFVERIARPKTCENLNNRSEQLSCLNRWITRQLQKNIRYPALACSLQQEEKIYVEFVVDEWGRVTSAQAKGAKNKVLAAEAVRAVKAFPELIPASQQQRPVKMRMVIPVDFKLQ
jgi:protein TonB